MKTKTFTTTLNTGLVITKDQKGTIISISSPKDKDATQYKMSRTLTNRLLIIGKITLVCVVIIVLGLNFINLFK